MVRPCHFPDSVPLRKRPTYWKWNPHTDHVDVIISSLDGMVLLLLETLEIGFGERLVLDPNDPSVYPRAFRVAAIDCTAPFVLKCAETGACLPDAVRVCSDGVTEKAHEKIGSAWRFDGAASPLQLQDYRRMAGIAGYEYIGVVVAESQSVVPGIPTTFFTETGLFRAAGATAPLAGVPEDEFTA